MRNLSESQVPQRHQVWLVRSIKNDRRYVHHFPPFEQAFHRRS